MDRTTLSGCGCVCVCVQTEPMNELLCGCFLMSHVMLGLDQRLRPACATVTITLTKDNDTGNHKQLTCLSRTLRTFLFFKIFVCLFLFLIWSSSPCTLKCVEACREDLCAQCCSNGIRKSSFPGTEQEEQTDAAPTVGAS